MPTKTTISRRTFTKPEKTAEDLCQGLAGQNYTNAIGFVSCSPESRYRDLISKLERDLPFPVVGGTTWAFPLAPHDEDLTASLTVYYQNDLKHAVCLSPILDDKNAREQMTCLYRNCLDKLGAEPKVIFAIMPILENMGADLYLRPLFEAVGEVPVFGGMVSDDFGSDRAAVLAEGQAWRDRLALIALGGDIEPVMSVRCELTGFSDYQPVVTEARGQIVRRVDGRTFADYVRRLNIDPEAWDLMSDWPMSVQVWGGLSEIDGQPEAADLIRLDPVDGSGTFLRDIPEGARICLCGLTKRNVIDSGRSCLTELSEKIDRQRARGREVSFLFVVSCLSRYYAMVGDERSVSAQVMSKLPENIGCFAYYGCNEICPTTDPEGRLFNRSHCNSIIACGI